MRNHLLLPTLFLFACSDNQPRGTFQQTIVAPARVQSALTCKPGASIAIDGQLALDSLQATVTMRNNAKGTHESASDVAASLMLVPADQTIEVPAQTVDGTVVADPVVSIQILDADGNPVGDEVVVGSCATGTLAVDTTALITATVTLDVAAAGCANHPGPTITLQGDITFEGLQERIVVRDGAGGAVTGEVTARADIVALKDGATLAIPKQPVRGGVGGNPWIYAQLKDGDGNALGEDVLIGRCAELAGETD